MNDFRKNVSSVDVIFTDGTKAQYDLEHGWLRAATSRIMKEGGGVEKEFQSLTLGGRITERHHDEGLLPDDPKSIPENGEAANGIDD